MKTLLALAASVLVVISQPKPYTPAGPDPDADSPIVQLSAEEPLKVRARVTVIFTSPKDGKSTMHLEMMTLGDLNSPVKVYTSRSAVVSVRDQPEIGALLLQMMAVEVSKMASDDGFDVTPKTMLEGAILKETE